MNKNLPLPLPSFRGRFFGNRYFCGIIMINSLMYSKRSTHPLTPLKRGVSGNSPLERGNTDA